MLSALKNTMSGVLFSIRMQGYSHSVIELPVKKFRKSTMVLKGLFW